MMGGMGMGMGPSMMGTMGTMPMLTSGTTTTGPTKGFMKMDMWEKDNKYFMMMDCAGCSKEDCNITVDEQNNMMTVTCERKCPCEPSDQGWICCERPYGKMSRSCWFPDTCDLEKADVKMENGMLCCCIPKRESPKGKQLRIK